MLTLIRTELLALRTIRLPWVLLAGAAVLTAALAVNPVLAAGTGGAPSIGTAGALLAVLGATGRRRPHRPRRSGAVRHRPDLRHEPAPTG